MHKADYFFSFIIELVLDVVSIVVVFSKFAPKTDDILGPEELDFPSLAQIP